jgi:hypothetical protein
MDDVKRKEPAIAIERKREWLHGAGGKGDNCSRKDKPVYTNPQKVPDGCREWMCDNGEWRSNGIVWRDKTTKQIARREGK